MQFSDKLKIMMTHLQQIGLGLWRFTPLSTIFQLCRGSQF